MGFLLNTPLSAAITYQPNFLTDTAPSFQPFSCPSKPWVPSPSPHPPPSPPSPSPYFLPGCQDGENGWPRFNDASSLAKDPVWSRFFKTIYGAIPNARYPICIFDFWFMWKDVAKGSGLTGDPKGNPDTIGDWYTDNNDFQPNGASW